MENSKGKLEKEKRKNGQNKALTKKQKMVILTQRSRSLCEVIVKDEIATGFLCNIPDPVLITNHNILNESQIEPGKEINICFIDENENKHHKKIKIDETRVTYTVGSLDGEEIDITIIELRPEIDDLNEQEFIEIDTDLMSTKAENSYD